MRSYYGSSTGIQPTQLTNLIRAVYPEYTVIDHNNWSLNGMFGALLKEHIVIVDIHVDNATQAPMAPGDNTTTFAHFAEVLGMDSNTVYLDNTLSGGFWSVENSLFVQAWQYPERDDDWEVPNQENHITQWGVEIVIPES